MNKPWVIAIAGPSCSGKTTLARYLLEQWGDRAHSVSLDRYYRDQAHRSMADRAEVNYDHPEAVESELLFEHVDLIRDGRRVDLPRYDFARHTRHKKTDSLHPQSWIVIEGLWPLYWDPLWRAFDVRIYVDIDEPTALARRIHRDTRERGRTEASVRQQYDSTVAPMQRLFVEPTKSRADVVLSGLDPIEELASVILKDHSGGSMS